MPGRPTGASVRPLIAPMGEGFFVQDRANSPSSGSMGSEKLWICPRVADCVFWRFCTCNSPDGGGFDYHDK